VSHARARLTEYGRWGRGRAGSWSRGGRRQRRLRLRVFPGRRCKWLRRFEAEGHLGLRDRASRPGSSPRRLCPRLEHRVLHLRRTRKLGPHRLAALTGVPRSTCYLVLRRHGLHRLAWMDRPSGEPIRRYERAARASWCTST
jgi:Homeodomain-like domain